MKRTIAFLAAAEAADLLTTWYGLAHGSRELNPLGVQLIAIGPLALVAYKVVPVAYAAVVGAILKGDSRTFWIKGVQFLAFLTSLVAAFNLGGAVRV